MSELPCQSRKSSRTRLSKSNKASSVRACALAKAAATRKIAEFEHINAQKELEQKKREVEYAKEMAIPNAIKQLAVAKQN